MLCEHLQFLLVVVCCCVSYGWYSERSCGCTCSCSCTSACALRDCCHRTCLMRSRRAACRCSCCLYLCSSMLSLMPLATVAGIRTLLGVLGSSLLVSASTATAGIVDARSLALHSYLSFTSTESAANQLGRYVFTTRTPLFMTIHLTPRGGVCSKSNSWFVLAAWVGGRALVSFAFVFAYALLLLHDTGSSGGACARPQCELPPPVCSEPLI